VAGAGGLDGVRKGGKRADVNHDCPSVGLIISLRAG
jgi:hypothetical protein